LAIVGADQAIGLDPDLTPAYGHKSFNRPCMNRLDDALLTVGRAAERKEAFADSILTQHLSPS
jgi:hypothetical protein